MQDVKDFKYYLAAFQYRKQAVFIIVAIIFLSGIAIAFGLPSVYRSTATILIEEQDIPPDLVRSTVTSYADQRIQVISQRVMTRANLKTIINKYQLYQDEMQWNTTEAILEMMRDDVILDALSADVIDPRSGRPTQATIAFSISYDSRQPGTAQRVANELVSLYLTENIKSRTQKAEETSEFLAVDAEKLSMRLAEFETNIARFKEANAGKLPEQTQLNLQFLDRTERDVRELKGLISSLKEQDIYLQGQLAQIEPSLSIISATGERFLGPEAKLKMLETEYISVSSRYAPEHPDVVKLRLEINALKKQVGQVSGVDDRGKELSRKRTALMLAREKYAATHPNVIRLENDIKALEKSLASEVVANVVSAGVAPENPAYITLQAQLEAVRSQLDAKTRQIQALNEKMTMYEERLTQAPQVEMEYLALTREQNNTLQRYNEVKAKQMEAQVAQELEKESKGERFTLIDPPQLPESPVKPNRMAILFLSFVLSLGGGVGFLVMSENLNQTVRDVRTMRVLTGRAPLATIPYIETDDDIKRTETVKILTLSSVFAALALLLIGIHVFIMPLDVIWFSSIRRIGDTLVWLR